MAPLKIIGGWFHRNDRLLALVYLIAIPAALIAIAIISAAQDSSQQAGIRRLAIEGAEAHRVLCADRDGLAETVARTSAFLAKNKTPVIRFGNLTLKRTDIQAQLIAQRRRLANLSDIHCP